MAAAALALVSRRVLRPEGEAPAAVLVRAGRIEAVVAPDAVPAGVPVRDFGDHVVMAGLVDSHVHVNEPGHTEWEGFATATRAAAAGGVTCLVDMPLNSIPVTTTRAALDVKRAAASGRCAVDVAFWGGVVPGNAGELPALLAAGVPGAKAFLIDSGLPEFGAATERDLRAALPVLASHGAVLLAHAELPHAPTPPAGAPERYASWLASRPAAWEEDAIELLLRLAGEYRCRVHVVHLSAASALARIAEAKAAGVPVTVETCPHYLTFDAESVPDGRTEWKCAPPIREARNRERLWQGLAAGTIDMIVSDHSPCAPEQKAGGDFFRSWGGVSSLQLALSAVWTEARRREIPLERVSKWMAAAPARLAGLGGRKGRLEAGYDADLTVFDPEATFVVRAEALRHRHALTPYLGRTLHGVVSATFVRGRAVFGPDAEETPMGELLLAGGRGLH